ncbi:hypothetical protein [Amycolatopsis sp. NPDC049868]|uniref:hypothetical protein n=1 Tax=Amycolatopsis sp. NPDC049868 TaxID=3363934 RepID=UPI003797A9A6
MALIVGVHGIGQQWLGRQQLLAAWGPALSDGLERAAGRRTTVSDFDIAFYGDIFLPDRDGVTNSAATKSGVPDFDLDLGTEEWSDVAEALAELVTPAEVAAAAVEVPKGFGRFPRPLQALLAAIDRRYGPAAAVLSIKELRQVRRYLREPAVREAVDDRVRDMIPADCRVVIGHSLGSVVAYELLRRNPGLGVEMLITAGSPLALRMVRDRLRVEPLLVPDWVNIRDPHDPVACAGELRVWWPQIRETDEIVVDNGAKAHAAERYLSRRQTGAALLRAIAQEAGR